MFKEKELKKSIVRDCKKAYELALWEKQKSTEPGKAVIVSSLDGKKRVRPPLLGTLGPWVSYAECSLQREEPIQSQRFYIQT